MTCNGNTDVIFEIPTIENPRIDISHEISSGGSFCTPAPPPQAQIGGLYGIIDVIYEILTFINPRIDISNNILSVGSFCPPLQPPSMGVRGFVEKY